MTCISAAICDDGKAIVTCSDRALSNHDVIMCFRDKTIELRPGIVILVAGDTNCSEAVLDIVAKTKFNTVNDYANCVKNVYNDYTKKHISDSFERYGVKLTEKFPEWLNAETYFNQSSKLRAAVPRAVFIIAGVDITGPNIRYVGREIDIDKTKLGYACESPNYEALYAFLKWKKQTCATSNADTRRNLLDVNEFATEMNFSISKDVNCHLLTLDKTQVI